VNALNESKRRKKETDITIEEKFVSFIIGKITSIYVKIGLKKLE